MTPLVNEHATFLFPQLTERIQTVRNAEFNLKLYIKINAVDQPATVCNVCPEVVWSLKDFLILAVILSHFLYECYS